MNRSDESTTPAFGPTPRALRVCVAQIRPRKADPAANLERVREAVAEEAGESDLLVFPETVVSGYHLEGGVEEVALTTDEVVEALGAPPADAPDLVLGFYERAPGAIHNTVVYLAAGRERWDLRHRHRKVFLPTYGVFQEGRFVTPGTELRAFDTRFGRIGLLICEEMLHSLCPTLLALDGAEVLVSVSATPARGFRPGPGRPANLERWDVAGRSIALEHGCPLVVAQLVGSEGGKLFAGGSTVYGPGGVVTTRAPLLREARLRTELDLSGARRERVRSPLLNDLRVMLPHLRRGLEGLGGTGDVGPLLEREGGTAGGRRFLPDPENGSVLELDHALVEEALVSFLRDEVRERRGFRDVVVGLSGGVDSAVSLLLAVQALGKEHVHAFLLPYRTSSPESLEHGRQLAEMAGVRHRVIPISEAVDGYVEAEEADMSPLRRGNAAARMRALVLWDQSARLGALPLGTGNKSERLLGFFTWHADDAPPVNPIGDLFKTQVWSLARHLGVPEVIVGKPPSPDLVSGIDDESELGVGYLLADRILYWLLEGFRSVDLVEAGFDRGAVEIVHRRLEGTHWKRHLPTVAMLSGTAIGEFYLRPVDY